MGFVPQFETDVFISYSHRDNKAIDGDGWVTAFQKRLEDRLGVMLGTDAVVWADARMQAGDVITDALQSRLRGAAVLTAIMSPSYVASQWCEWELKGFIQRIQQDGFKVENKSRALKVIKLPDQDDHYAETLPDVKDMPFFVRRAEGHAAELAPGTDPYNVALDALAAAIADILKAMRKRQTVFLGAAPPGLQAERDKLQKELDAYKYRVLTPSTDNAKTDSDLEESGLRVHFVDSDDGTDTTALQKRIADAPGDAQQVMVVKTNSPGETKLWSELPAGTGGSKPDVLVNPQPASLKTTVMDTLNRSAPPQTASDSTRRVYLICHQDDNPLLAANRARALRDLLISQGIEVKVPLAERDADVDFSADNRAKLKECDAVILYWGKSGQGWFDQRLMELTKARGWRKDHPFSVTAGYVADPETVIKTNFETRDVDVLIKQLASLDPADQRLQSLLGKLSGHNS
jgi:hypothetical protein